MLVKVKFTTPGLKSFGLREQREVEVGEIYEMHASNLSRYPDDAIVVLGPVASTVAGPGPKAGINKAKKTAAKKEAPKKAAKKAAKKKAGKKKAAKKKAAAKG